MRCFGYRSAVAAGQIRRRRSVFQQRIEHRVWSAGDGKYSFENNDWHLEKSGHQCLVTHALITQGIALARSGRKEHAQFIFQKAIEAALQIDALNAAGLATLTLIEEVDQLSPAMLQAAYQQAREWLTNSERQDVLRRLSDAGGKVVSSAQSAPSEEGAVETLLTKPSGLQDMMLKHEKALIKQALVQTNGSVTRAASLLGTSYQALCYMIESRHPDLLKQRTPIRRRTKKSDK